MVFTNKYTKNLLKKFQNFANSKSLQEAIELYSEKETVDSCTIFTGLTDYVTDELIKKNKDISTEELSIYKYVEEIREKFSDFPENSDEFDFDNAVCVCFLENLLNRASAKTIEYDRFIPFLGKKSKEYCKAWDKFTGVKTEGLWDNK